jgi:hypothetical protein
LVLGRCPAHKARFLVTANTVRLWREAGTATCSSSHPEHFFFLTPFVAVVLVTVGKWALRPRQDEHWD